MRIALGFVAALLSSAATPQTPAPPDPAAQKAALAGLAAFDGSWRGAATIYRRGQPPLQLIHTERVGSTLDGTLKVIEGKSFLPDGREAGFNALAVISCYQPTACEMRSYAQGRAGTFPISITTGGYSWSFEAGPGMKIVYTAKLAGTVWSEEGWIEREGQRLGKIFDMQITKVGPTDWPAAGAMAPR